MSKGYITLVDLFFNIGLTDLQCGFKAIKRTAWEDVQNYAAYDNFFFDTGLIAWAMVLGYKVGEVPAKWHEGDHSTVRFFRDIPLFLQGLLHLRRHLIRHPQGREIVRMLI